ncbi:MAG: hypothetical protein H0T47_07220 [Planctomycetaceae bacterium]|nr:hypothetical protein [Planctomycetaceae bacterium]
MLRLTPRDQALLAHVARYRLTTVDVVQRLLRPNVSRNAIGKVLSRLCAAGLLHKYPLLHPTLYYVLGDGGAQALGIGTHRTLPLGPQSLPMEYGVLLYATLGSERRQRLTKQELLTRCAWLPAALAESPHCKDIKQAVLELVRVDLGGPADHVARKCAADLREREKLREFSLLVKEGRFRLVIVTSTAEKSVAVRQALNRHEWPQGLRIHLSIVSQLLPLTARRAHA